jgi:hypothetical protein
MKHAYLKENFTKEGTAAHQFVSIDKNTIGR